ncbi:hypothetical protein ACF061_00895 [Streptomyces sp. NPDC015220]|uniref:hypothetical protein n=1 Tax=Streptomyces sp. NPDC015220 TaxID=3364947 RepID=UPI0036FF7D91
MATTDLIGTPVRAEHPATAPVLTEPASPAAVAAMRRLGWALALPMNPDVVRAVTEYEVAAEHARDLAAVAASGRMTDLDADSLAAAVDLMAGARAVLADADLLDLIGLAR